MLNTNMAGNKRISNKGERVLIDKNGIIHELETFKHPRFFFISKNAIINLKSETKFWSMAQCYLSLCSMAIGTT